MKTVSPTRTFTAVAMSSKGKVIHFCHLDFQICIGNEKDFSRTSLGPLQLGSVFTSAFLPKINYCTDKNWVYFCHFYRFINHGYSPSEDFILFECAALSIKDVTYLLPAIWGCSTEKLFRGVQENLNNICGRILLLNFQAHLIGNLGIYQGHFPGNFLEILITYWTPRANCFCIVSDFGGKIKLALAPINKFRALFSGVKLETRVFTFFSQQQKSLKVFFIILSCYGRLLLDPERSFLRETT